MQQKPEHKIIEVEKKITSHLVNYVVEDNQTKQSVELSFIHTNHSCQKAARRGISDMRISTALEYGEQILKQGLLFYVLGADNIPTHLTRESKKLQNIVVVTDANSNQIITCYRSNEPFRRIKKKSKRLYTPEQMAA